MNRAKTCNPTPTAYFELNFDRVGAKKFSGTRLEPNVATLCHMTVRNRFIAVSCPYAVRAVHFSVGPSYYRQP